MVVSSNSNLVMFQGSIFCAAIQVAFPTAKSLVHKRFCKRFGTKIINYENLDKNAEVLIFSLNNNSGPGCSKGG